MSSSSSSSSLASPAVQIEVLRLAVLQAVLMEVQSFGAQNTVVAVAVVVVVVGVPRVVAVAVPVV
eukprot:1675049-Pyramimonas_sp.AAC.1